MCPTSPSLDNTSQCARPIKLRAVVVVVSAVVVIDDVRSTISGVCTRMAGERLRVVVLEDAGGKIKKKMNIKLENLYVKRQ